MGSMRKISLCLIALLLSNCATVTAETAEEKPLTFCEGVAGPFTFAKAELVALTPETGREALDINATGEKFCGWSGVGSAEATGIVQKGIR